MRRQAARPRATSERSSLWSIASRSGGQGQPALMAAERFIDRLPSSDRIAVVTMPQPAGARSGSTSREQSSERITKALGTWWPPATNHTVFPWERSRPKRPRRPRNRPRRRPRPPRRHRRAPPNRARRLEPRRARPRRAARTNPAGAAQNAPPVQPPGCPSCHRSPSSSRSRAWQT